MNTQFQNMNEAYIEKNYPNRSIFEAFAKRNKKSSVGVYLFFGAILAACLYGIIWSMGSIADYKLSGDTEMAETGVVICIILAVFALIPILCIGLTIWRSKRGAGDWMKKCAAHSKLEEGKLREFERQAMMSDSYILKLTSGLNKAVTGQRDGILTRDYIYLADDRLTVIPIENLVCVCLVKSVYYVGDMQHRKEIPYLALYLLSKNGVESFAESSPEAGAALTELLRQRTPQIETYDGRVISVKEYEDDKKGRIA